MNIETVLRSGGPCPPEERRALPASAAGVRKTYDFGRDYSVPVPVCNHLPGALRDAGDALVYRTA